MEWLVVEYSLEPNHLGMTGEQNKVMYVLVALYSMTVNRSLPRHK